MDLPDGQSRKRRMENGLKSRETVIDVVVSSSVGIGEGFAVCMLCKRQSAALLRQYARG